MVTDAALLLGVGAVVVAVVMVRSGRRQLYNVTRMAAVCGVVVAVGWIGLLRRTQLRSGWGTFRGRAFCFAAIPGVAPTGATGHRDVVGAAAATGEQQALDGWSSASSP